MGNTMTFVRRLVVRKTRRFNVHNRAEKYFEKHQDKPIRAPLYEATMREVERLSKELPDLTEKMKKKDESLLSNLRQVYVTSEGDNKDNFSKTKVDASPESRYLDATKINREVATAIPAGKYNFQTGLNILAKYQNNPMVNSHHALAKQFNLDPAVVAKITRHVKILDFVDTRVPLKYTELVHRELVPHSFQGSKTEFELYEEMLLESRLRAETFYKRIAKLEEGKETKESIENPSEPLISQETTDKLEKIYMEMDIYRKTGKLPPEPVMIADEEIDKLKLTYTKQIAAESNEKKDDDLEDKQKVAKQT